MPIEAFPSSPVGLTAAPPQPTLQLLSLRKADPIVTAPQVFGKSVVSLKRPVTNRASVRSTGSVFTVLTSARRRLQLKLPVHWGRESRVLPIQATRTAITIATRAAAREFAIIATTTTPTITAITTITITTTTTTTTATATILLLFLLLFH